MTDTVHFSTTLSPHRSLSAEGFKWLIRGVLAANVAIGLPMYFFGAWPVVGFLGLDVVLLWWLFQRSYFDARRRETLTLTDRELIVERRSPDGAREEIRLDSYWLRIEPSEERLIVVSRGNRVVVGRFLSPEERDRLADELKAAQARMRAPRYQHRWDDES